MSTKLIPWDLFHGATRVSRQEIRQRHLVFAVRYELRRVLAVLQKALSIQLNEPVCLTQSSPVRVHPDECLHATIRMFGSMLIVSMARSDVSRIWATRLESEGATFEYLMAQICKMPMICWYQDVAFEAVRERPPAFEQSAMIQLCLSLQVADSELAVHCLVEEKLFARLTAYGSGKSRSKVLPQKWQNCQLRYSFHVCMRSIQFQKLSLGERLPLVLPAGRKKKVWLSDDQRLYILAAK